MYQAQYLLCLDCRDFVNSEIQCYGDHFCELLTHIERILPPHVWYGGDICTSDKRFFSENRPEESYTDETVFPEFQIKAYTKIGTIKDFKEQAQYIFQILSGDFIAIKNEVQVSSLEVESDDASYRKLNIEGVYLELRIFDSFNFLLFSDKCELIKYISTIYGKQMYKFSGNDKSPHQEWN